MITTTDALGYIVIALIAFALGITVTLFCISLKNRQTGKDNEEEE